MAVADTAVPGVMMRTLRVVSWRLSELVHVCAVYLGITVLVSGVLAFAVPSLRQQASEVHAALMVALQPDMDVGAGFGTQEDPDSPLYRAGRESGRIPPEDQRAADIAEGASRPEAGAQLSFAQALRASEAGQFAAGLTRTQSQALRSYIARKYRVAGSVAGALVNTVFVVAREHGLDPQLVLAVIAIESRYNPYAESHVGAQGLMQVMTRVHRDKFEAFADGQIAALNPIANIRVGTQILNDCIKRRGSTEGGLACYVGATGPNDGGYGNKVVAEWRRIALASGLRMTDR